MPGLGAGPPTRQSLIEICLNVAVHHDFWRVQRRQLACLPEDVANELLRRLLEQRRISPPQLELFRHCATSVSVSGAGITGPWLSYLGSFSALHSLRLRRCTKVRDSHLQHLPALAPTLQELDLGGCSALGGGAAQHLLPLTALRFLGLSATALGSDGVRSLCSALTSLTSLSLADVPADDACCQALGQHVRGLQRLDLSGSAVGDGGMRHLEQLHSLTSLDISLTQVHSPPLLSALRHLSMNSCQLGLADDSAQEALWLHLGAGLPKLQRLELAGASLAPANGEELLQRLLAGAAGSLRRVDLRDCGFSGNLEPLAGASQLTWLDLSGTHVADRHLADLALLPLEWASLSGTAVGDEGVAQLLAMARLTRLDLSKTRAGDGCWGVLSQLPWLSWLDLSGTGIAFSSVPEGSNELGALTYLNLNHTQVEDRGCRHLAACAPRLTELWLGSKTVGDRGLKALCTLPALEQLHLFNCGVSDPGLLSALPRCPTLRQLSLTSCWLASVAGAQAAAVAAAQAGGCLHKLSLDGTDTPVPASSPTARRGVRARRHSAGSSAQAGTQAPAPPSGPPPSTPAAPSLPTRPRAAAVLSPDVLAHDERLAYSREEMLSLGKAWQGSERGVSGSSPCQQLRQRLPPDLVSPL